MADWIGRQVNNATKAAGGYAGGLVNQVGNGVSAAGKNASNGYVTLPNPIHDTILPSPRQTDPSD